MSKKTRYVLIALGFIVFLILAPLTILYVTGLKYDFATGRFLQTGILAVRSDPSSVNVFLNGEKIRTSDGDLKFLSPGEYNVTLKKDGYETWSKRFFVQANQVTWANPIPGKITLFKKSVSLSALSSEVLDMSLTGSEIVALTPIDITVTSINNQNNSEHFPLPKPASSILASPDRQTFVLQNTNGTTSTSTLIVFTIKNKGFTDLSGLLQEPYKVQFADNGDLYALSQNTLYKIAINQKKITLVTKNVRCFTISQENIYYINSSTGTTNSLFVQPLFGGQPQVLISSIPAFSSGRLFVNFQKQMLVQLDGVLYRVSDTLIPVASDVSDAKFNEPASTLLIFHNGQLDLYDYTTQRFHFITRTSLPISSFFIRQDMDYAFFIKDKRVEALELDLRDHQNEYDFYDGASPSKIFLSDDGKTLFILDGGNLLSKTIR